MEKNNILKLGLICGLLISTLPYTTSIKAINQDAIITTGAVALSGAASYLGISWYSNHVYRGAKKRYKILNKFKNIPEYDYEDLKEDATTQYYQQCCIDSESVDNDYPGVWVEKDATAKKNFLAMMFLSTKMKNMAKKLTGVLKHIRKNKEFKGERKKYNKLAREQSYRNERLRIEREKLFAKRFGNN